jgi:hypothetical protein
MQWQSPLLLFMGVRRGEAAAQYQVINNVGLIGHDALAVYFR